MGKHRPGFRGVQAIDDARTIAELQATIARLSRERSASLQRRVETLAELKQIVGAISVIAATMKRLSVNAAIESARVGEAGLGFSVVASEMKGLANAAQTAAAKATALLGARDRDQDVGAR